MYDRSSPETSFGRRGRPQSRLRKLALSALVPVMLIALIGHTPAAEAQAGKAVSTLRSGSWSDATIWSGGSIPGSADTVLIKTGHDIVYDMRISKVAGVSVEANAALIFAPTRSATLETDRNVIVRGRLAMRPESAAVQHLLRYIGIDEAAIVGGADHDLKHETEVGSASPIQTDVGTWVLGDGQLDLAGTPKTSWTRLAGGSGAGATSIALEKAPAGWRPGDDLAITPTQSPAAGSVAWTGYSHTGIHSVTGTTAVLTIPTRHAHPRVDDRWAAEVLNLSRNVRIEGTPTGRAHTFIESRRPQTINYVQFRHMGPRDQQDVRVLGRYALHFHMMQNLSRGSMVEGTVVRDDGNHAFAPHASHGITFRDTIAHNTREFAYWWDQKDSTPGKKDTVHTHSALTNDTLIEGCVASATAAPKKTRRGSIVLNDGDNNTMRGCVAVGMHRTGSGSSMDNAGFVWDVSNGGIWNFDDNIAHNNDGSGIFVWTNGKDVHAIDRFVAYHNTGTGINNGAYVNCFHYKDNHLYGNAVTGLLSHALSWEADKCDDINRSRRSGQLHSGLVVDGAGLSDYAIMTTSHSAIGKQPTVIENCHLKGARKAAVGIGYPDRSTNNFDWYDIVNCRFEGKAFDFHPAISSAANVRVEDPVHGALQLRRFDQPGTLHREWNASTTSIPTFTGPRITGDINPPTVSVMTPFVNATMSGTASLMVNASDNVGVTKVEFYRGSKKLGDGRRVSGTALDSTWQLTWDTKTRPNGPIKIHARAYDREGNYGVSYPREAIISNP
jgi:hypothetical protein